MGVFLQILMWLRPLSGVGSCSNLLFKSSTWNLTLVNNIIEADSVPPHLTVKNLTVDEDSAGQRLDNFLMRHLKGVPKTHIYRIIRTGEVRINKARAEAKTRLETGDIVRLPPVRVATKNENAPVAPSKEFPILLEDDCLLAINKPSGIAVHGGSGINFGVIEQLRQSRSAVQVLELVHRLDRETSGVLLIAKKRSCLRHVQDQFRGRETGKTYLAMVRGLWPSNKKVIDLHLHKYVVSNGTDEGERRVKVVSADDPNGQRAITLVKILRLVGEYSVLEVTIKTGRTHQIRVHLANQGHPILGDDKYGDFEVNKKLHAQGLQRMFLHAWKLQLTHPQTGLHLNLQAPLPEALQQFIHHVQPTSPPI